MGLSLLQLGIPVRDERKRDSALWGVGFNDQKAAAISGHIKRGTETHLVGVG